MTIDAQGVRRRACFALPGAVLTKVFAMKGLQSLGKSEVQA